MAQSNWPLVLNSRRQPIWVGAALLCLAQTIRGAEPLPANVEFNRDIRPILSENCFQCHGPDKARRKANLRFDIEEGPFADLDGRRAIVRGDLGKSEMFRRITAADESERMPPVRSGHKLTTRQIELIRCWIEQGAPWQKHWSLIPPRRPALPPLKDATWPRNAIDTFILDRLLREGLTPSAEADRPTLIRRVTLDLTGLPPSPAEVDSFLADRSPDAYEKVVDRLLASPRYGERMATPWLNAARYADTNGYQSDGERTMWRWRDWVIDAFNSNMPFDHFTIEQIAGDMLPGATLDQNIATGFNRNHRGNGEGGIIPEEYAVEYVVDRVDTTGTVWLGLTLGCARCHDHKFDPIKQKEFYQLYAYFNNIPEKGKAIKFGNSPPSIKTPTAAQQEELRKLDRELATAEGEFARLKPEIALAQATWEHSLHGKPPIHWSIQDGLIAHFPLDGNALDRCGPSRHISFRDGKEAFVHGRTGQAGAFDGTRFIDAGNVAEFGYLDKFSCAAWIYAGSGKGGTILSRMTDAAEAEGYSFSLEAGKLHVNLVKRWLDDALRVETDCTLEPGRWHHVAMTYDGSRLASGIKVYVNGRPAKLTVLLDDLNQNFQSHEPFRIGAGSGPEGRFHGLIDDVRVYDRSLSNAEAGIISVSASISEIAAIAMYKRSTQQRNALRAYFLHEVAPEPIRQTHRSLVALRRQRERFFENLPTTMVMAEMPGRRDTFVLVRGVYDKPGEKVSAGVPATLGSLSAGAINNRLGFARWLVDPANPLTSRVAVNRYWQMYFGAGLVKTVDDFGAQGEWPSHPELLDWLASEFVRTRWDVKAMQKLIVMSATYRQSSKVTRVRLQRDPENRLLARGPRFRLPAEMIRDQALAASGLLVEKIGGPSVKPYQPKGLWKELADTEYVQDHGGNLYRRSLYTFWKRTVAPPSMVTFDAAGREACVVRETRTNTPLQALTLMNEVTYVEAARVLAQRIMKEGGATPEERLTLAFRLVTARQPRPGELKILVDGFQNHLRRYRKDPQSSLLLIRAGEAPNELKRGTEELAAYSAMVGLILNLDETVNKQ